MNQEERAGWGENIHINCGFPLAARLLQSAVSEPHWHTFHSGFGEASCLVFPAVFRRGVGPRGVVLHLQTTCTNVNTDTRLTDYLYKPSPSTPCTCTDEPSPSTPCTCTDEPSPISPLAHAQMNLPLYHPLHIHRWTFPYITPCTYTDKPSPSIPSLWVH